MTHKRMFWAAVTAAVPVWSVACGPVDQGAPASSAGGRGSGGDLLGSGGVSSASGGAPGDDPIGTLDDAEDFARFMSAIALPFVGVLGALKDVSVNEAQCPMGGAAVIDRDLGEATFTDCKLGDITLYGVAVLADGGSTETQQSSILAGGAFSLSGAATGSILIQLAQFTWQEPPTKDTTTWRANFDDGMSGQICVQSSGEPC